MRLVLDTSILVAAIRSNLGASNRLVDAGLTHRFTLVGSVPLFLEYEAVLTRQEHLRASGLSLEEVGMLLDALAAVVDPVRLSYLWRPILRDADDDMVMEAAINGSADAIVTFNHGDFTGSEQFGIRVIRPGRALRELGEFE